MVRSFVWQATRPGRCVPRTADNAVGTDSRAVGSSVPVQSNCAWNREALGRPAIVVAVTHSHGTDGVSERVGDPEECCPLGCTHPFMAVGGVEGSSQGARRSTSIMPGA